MRHTGSPIGRVLALVITCATLLTTGCAVQPAPEPDRAVLRVMSYNIAAGHGNLDRIIEVIRGSGADVVALQEVDVHWSERSGFADQAALLGDALGMEVFYAPIYTFPPAE